MVGLAREELPWDELRELPDDEVKARLVAVRGLGEWTADWYLARHLGRPRAWPAGDSGLGGSVSYSHDSRGSQTQAGSRTFAWTLNNRLASTTDAGTTLNYAYDGDGARLQAAGGGQTTNFRWDSNFVVPQLALERDDAGSVLRSYVHGHGPVAMRAGGQSSYFHPDALGSIANLTSQSGATQWTYSYEPYGLARSTTKNDSAAPDNPLRFAGEYLDDATSLYHLRARQLDPATGRFLATDPLQRSAMVAAIGSYTYTDDRPTVFVDPLGLGPVGPQPNQPPFGSPGPLAPFPAGPLPEPDRRGCTGFGGSFRCFIDWDRSGGAGGFARRAVGDYLHALREDPASTIIGTGAVVVGVGALIGGIRLGGITWSQSEWIDLASGGWAMGPLALTSGGLISITFGVDVIRDVENREP